MSQYADYTFYRDSYYGTQIALADFPKLCQEASGYLDKLTYRRLLCGAPVSDGVRLAVCAVCDVLDTFHQSEIHRDISSENNDGYSVSYVPVAQRLAMLEKEKWEAVGNYLPLSDPLRYSGV